MRSIRRKQSHRPNESNTGAYGLTSPKKEGGPLFAWSVSSLEHFVQLPRATVFSSHTAASTPWSLPSTASATFLPPSGQYETFSFLASLPTHCCLTINLKPGRVLNGAARLLSGRVFEPVRRCLSTFRHFYFSVLSTQGPDGIV